MRQSGLWPSMHCFLLADRPPLGTGGPAQNVVGVGAARGGATGCIRVISDMQGLGTRIEQQWLLQWVSVAAVAAAVIAVAAAVVAATAIAVALLPLLLLLPQPAPRGVDHALVVHHVEGVDVHLRRLLQVMVTHVQAAMGRGVTRQPQPAKPRCETLSSFKVLVLQLQHMPHGQRR